MANDHLIDQRTDGLMQWLWLPNNSGYNNMEKGIGLLHMVEEDKAG